MIHVDQELDYKITFLANDFETFVRGLVNKSVYDRSAERLQNALKVIDTGSFSSLLAGLICNSGDPAFGYANSQVMPEAGRSKRGFRCTPMRCPFCLRYPVLSLYTVE